MPNAPAVMVIHDDSLVALHAQLAPAVTATDPFAAAAVEKFADVGAMPGVQSALNESVLQRLLDMLPEGLMAFTTAS